VVARVEDAVLDAEGLGDVEAALAVDRERDGVADVGFGGDEVAHQLVRELEAADLLLRLLARRRDVHRRLAGLAAVLVLRWQRQGQDQQRHQATREHAARCCPMPRPLRARSGTAAQNDVMPPAGE
jgi:hypothetical protein